MGTLENDKKYAETKNHYAGMGIFFYLNIERETNLFRQNDFCPENNDTRRNSYLILNKKETHKKGI